VRRALLGTILATVVATPAPAQLARRLTADVGAGSLRSVVSDGAGVTGTLSGAAAFGSGAVRLGPVTVVGSYLQGQVTPDTGSGASRDVVEAGLAIAARPVGWLALGGGVLARAYILPSGTERWVWGVLRARAEGSIVAPVIRTHAEVWRAVSTDINIGTGSGSAMGGAAGLTLRLPQAPFWGRLVYAIDRAELSDGTRAETFERLAISVGYGGL
jgi:hypothetical protein